MVVTNCYSHTVVHNVHKCIKSSVSIYSYTLYNYCYHIQIDTGINSSVMRNVICAMKFNNDLSFLTFCKTGIQILNYMTELHVKYDHFCHVQYISYTRNHLMTCTGTHKCTQKTPLEINYMYLGNKEISCIFKICCIISVLFSTKFHLFCNFHNFIFIIFSFSNNIHIVNKLY